MLRLAIRPCTLVVAAASLTACGGPREEPSAAVSNVAAALSSADTTDDLGFARAIEPRPFVFPTDHGPHPAYRTEWWYLTGHLVADGERPFGYQATFFRNTLDPDPPARESEWATAQVYMAHFGVTDARTERFRSFERFARGAQGLAGAVAMPFRVWVEDWELEALSDTYDPLPPLALRMEAKEVAIDLRLSAAKPIVLHGNRGLSRKGTAAGNASYYYSFTRLETSGTLRVDGVELAVLGTSWLDREWSTSVLESGTVGWDWFSLQLDEGSDLMYFTLRRDDGATGTASGTWVAPDGTSRTLTASDVTVTVTERWRSPHTDAVYPGGWRLEVPGEGLEVTIRPRLADQELVHTFAYWEGAVTIDGTRNGSPVGGVGYVELTGYAEGAALRGGT